jgi:hypothetical protein
VMQGGGGPGLLNCRDRWHLFNGNAEHETRPFKTMRGHKQVIAGHSRSQ